MTDKLKAAAEMALEALECSYNPSADAQNEAITALRQALAEPDMGIDRGAWSDVPNATQWVDELRGDEFECPRCGHCCQQVEQPEPIGEVQIEQLDRPFNAGKVVLHFYGEPPPVGTKLYAATAKREWVELTVDEILTTQFAERHIDAEFVTTTRNDLIQFAKQLETILREKNA